jgi:hypothetical protein
MVTLDPARIDQFLADGFLAFDTRLSTEAIDHLRQILKRLHDARTGFMEGAQFDALGVDDGSEPPRFPQILYPRSFAPDLVDNDFFRMAHGIAEQILGPGVRFKSDISFMKPAEIGSATPWHQDEAFHDPAFDYNEISFWLALQPVDEVNGCMAYIPGSHKGPVLPHGFPGNDPRIHALECIDGFDPDKAVRCPLPAGGCVIHNGRTLHGAGPNQSYHDRMAYVLIFDRVPTPARQPREFPWREQQDTARARRERVWRRNGGLVVHLWRQRSRVRVTNLRTILFDLRRAARAMRRAILTPGLARPSPDSLDGSTIAPPSAPAETTKGPA